jgi:hypothetical protein
VKLTEEQFYQMWYQYAKECKTKDDLRQALGLTDIHPLETCRDRMTAKGYVFPPTFSVRPCARDRHSLTVDS